MIGLILKCATALRRLWRQGAWRAHFRLKVRSCLNDGAAVACDDNGLDTDAPRNLKLSYTIPAPPDARTSSPNFCDAL